MFDQKHEFKLIQEVTISGSIPVEQCSVVAVCFKTDETQEQGCVEQGANG